MESIPKQPQEFESSGDRLNHILDQLGFRSGRGRLTDFQNYLIEASPDVFKELKYSTVKSWFQNATPTMRRMDSVIAALQKNYSFKNDVSLIKTWWKVGGFYPFVNGALDQVTPAEALDEDDDQKMQFIVMSLVMEETGELFKSLSSKDLVKLKDKTIAFAKDFADPFKTQCPSEYLRMAIKGELEKIKENL